MTTRVARFRILEHLNDPVVVALGRLIARDVGGRRTYWLDWRYRAIREGADALGMRLCLHPACGMVFWPTIDERRRAGGPPVYCDQHEPTTRTTLARSSEPAGR